MCLLPHKEMGYNSKADFKSRQISRVMPVKGWFHAIFPDAL
jgi:hypothetical protein